MQLLEQLLAGPLRSMEQLEQQIFALRFAQHLPDVERPLRQLYTHREDYDAWLERFLILVAKAYAARPAALRLLDLKRVEEPDWFQQSRMMGYVCYADRFADNLNGVATKIPYLKELGITYLHLMPLLKPRPGTSDGGYAVMDYRAVRHDLGTMDDLADLAAHLRAADMSLCIDLVCNHTAKEHAWAQQALAGDPDYQAYYHMFPDRTLPDQYEETVREIMGLDDLQRVPMGSQLCQSGRVWRNARHHALPRQSGRRNFAPGCGGFHVEADRHRL